MGWSAAIGGVSCMRIEPSTTIQAVVFTATDEICSDISVQATSPERGVRLTDRCGDLVHLRPSFRREGPARKATCESIRLGEHDLTSRGHGRREPWSVVLFRAGGLGLRCEYRDNRGRRRGDGSMSSGRCRTTVGGGGTSLLCIRHVDSRGTVGSEFI